MCGMLSQATKNKTYTPKNIRSFMLREQGGGGFEYNENNFKKNN